ncbi:MAG: DUF1573 domain-containing protein [bacterium]|nr:DUF1573 domain-containing protein [bacterium]
MSDKKLIIGVIAVSVAIMVGGLFINAKVSTPQNVSFNNDAKLRVDKSVYDWGNISMQNGKVEAKFNIENTGTSDLKLYNANTSCHCTTAQLLLDGESSPLFGMNTKSPYVMVVPVGKKAELKVVFDPAFHGPNGVGAISRRVLVSTNDTNNSQLSFSLTAFVAR